MADAHCLQNYHLGLFEEIRSKFGRLCKWRVFHGQYVILDEVACDSEHDMPCLASVNVDYMGWFRLWSISINLDISCLSKCQNSILERMYSMHPELLAAVTPG